MVIMKINNSLKYQKLIKQLQKKKKRKKITKQMILDAQLQTKSNAAASRWLDVTYNTYKKWAKYYNLFEQHKNQSGVGIKKGYSYVINPNSKKYKYFSPDDLPKHNSVVYWLGLDRKDSIEFDKKWNCNPIKVGKSKDLFERVNEVLGRYYSEMLPKTEMWKEWLEKAKPLGWLNFWTEEEAKKVERVFHNRLKSYKMNAGSTKEMFDTSVEQIEEIEKEMYSYRKKDMKNSKSSLETNIPDSSNNKDLIQTIMMEWAYRVPNGMPDTKNEIHLNHLKLLLKEMNMPDKFIEGLYKNLL